MQDTFSVVDKINSVVESNGVSKKSDKKLKNILPIIKIDYNKAKNNQEKYDTENCALMNIDGTYRIDAEAIRHLQNCIKGLKQTKEFHFKNGEYSKERLELHDDIIEEFFNKAKCLLPADTPIAIMTGGSPGSGKSTYINKNIAWLNNKGLLHIDADEIRAKLPEYKGWNASQTVLETNEILNKLLDRIGEPCDVDILYDGTMTSVTSHLKLLKKIKSLGYKTFIIYMKIKKEDSLRRILKRYERDGRFVPPIVVYKFFENEDSGLNEIKKLVDGYVVIDSYTFEVLERGGMAIPKNRNHPDLPVKDVKKDIEKFKTKVRRKIDNITIGYAKGRDTEVYTAEGRNKSLKGYYAVMELDDLIASHDAFDFSINKFYPPKCQEREYHNNKQLQYNVENNAKNYDPVMILNEDKTAENGCPIVTPEGVVLGGNSRIMTAQRVYKSYKEKWKEYQESLYCRLDIFCIDKKLVDDMKKPFLVRIIPNVDISQCSRYSWLLNTSLKNAEPIATKAINYAKEINEKGLEMLGEVLASSEVETFSELIANKEVKQKIVKILYDVGIINTYNSSQFIKDDNWTIEGKIYVEAILVSIVLNDKQLIESARAYTDKIIKSIPYFIRIKRLDNDWNIIQNFENAIKLENARRSSGMKKEKFLQQIDMFDSKPISKIDLLAWDLLDSKIKHLKMILEKYIKTAESNSTDNSSMFDTKKLDPIEVLAQIRTQIAETLSGLLSGLSNNLSDYIVQENTKNTEREQANTNENNIHNYSNITDIDAEIERRKTIANSQPQSFDQFLTQQDEENYDGTNYEQDIENTYNDEYSNIVEIPKLMNANDISSRQFTEKPLKLVRTKLLFGKLLDDANVLIYGHEGSGKSTFALLIGEDLSLNGKVLYMYAEQKIGQRLKELMIRNRINAPNLEFLESSDFNTLKMYLETGHYKSVIIDSHNVIENASQKEMIGLMRVYPNINFIIISRMDKAKKVFKGDGDWSFEVDSVVHLDGGLATMKKHRDGESGTTMQVIKKYFKLV